MGKLVKFTSKLYFKDLYHPEDAEFVEFAKLFCCFYSLEFANLKKKLTRLFGFTQWMRFPELHYPEDHQLVKFIKHFFVAINSTLRLYHGLLRNKHNEILLKLASGVLQHTPKLQKLNKQHRFPEFHHLEDHQLVKFFKIFQTRLCGFTTGFWGTSTITLF